MRRRPSAAARAVALAVGLGVAACCAIRAQAAEPVAVTLANPGFEDVAGGGPAGWSTTQHAGVPSYTFTTDEQVAKSGRRSVRIDNVGREPFGALYQALPAAPFLGKRLRFRAELRARDIAGKGYNGAFLLVQAMHAGVPIAENRMMDRPLRGTRDWHPEAVELVIPSTADQVEIGVMLLGAGAVWIDDAQLEIMP